MKHILFPSDLSSVSAVALKQAVALAERFDAKITLLHDYALIGDSMLAEHELISRSLHDMENYIEEQARQKLEALAAEIKEAGVAYELLLLRGHAGQLIVDTAIQSGCDMIVMGCRGLNSFDALLYGSTSTYVLHHSPCPVMIIPVTQS